MIFIHVANVIINTIFLLAIVYTVTKSIIIKKQQVYANNAIFLALHVRILMFNFLLF